MRGSRKLRTYRPRRPYGDLVEGIGAYDPTPVFDVEALVAQALQESLKEQQREDERGWVNGWFL